MREACRFKKLSDLNQHLRSQTHQHAAQLFVERPEAHQLLTEVPVLQRNVFYQDLAEAFIAANIPWVKLNISNSRIFSRSTPAKMFQTNRRSEGVI